MTEFISATTTILDAALACFERVQIARSFDQDFNSHRIKLDIIQLRLSRWGEAAGLYSSGDSSSNSTALTEEAELKAAQGLLQAITDQFDMAQEQAKSMQPQQQQSQKAVDSIDPAQDLSSPVRTLRAKLRAALGRRRAQVVNVTHSVQWAFYKKQQFDEFVADLSENIDALEALFPQAAKEEAAKRLQELGAAECAGINKVYLKVLGAVTKDFDPYLDAAVVDALKPRESAAGKNIYMSNDGVNHGQQIGEMSGSQKGFSFGTTNNFGKGATNHWGGGN